MSNDEAEVLDYIDTLLGDAPPATPAGPAPAAADTTATSTSAPMPAADAAAIPADGTGDAAPGAAAADPDTPPPATPPAATATAGGAPAADGPGGTPAAPAAEASGACTPSAAPAARSDAFAAPAPPDAPGDDGATQHIDPAGAPAPPTLPAPPPRPDKSLRAGTPPAAAQAGHAPRWLRVAVDGASYALELLRVQEVVRMMPIVPMRGAQPAVLGVMNLRGRIVPVFDLGLWLGTGRVQAGEQSRIVVVERDDELIGLLVSAVDDVVSLGRDRIEPPLPGDGRGVVLGVARVGEAPTVLLDAYALYG